jgi:hypothetical protein
MPAQLREFGLGHEHNWSSLRENKMLAEAVGCRVFVAFKRLLVYKSSYKVICHISIRLFTIKLVLATRPLA